MSWTGVRSAVGCNAAGDWPDRPGGPPDWLKGQQLMNRLIALNAMKASDEITEEQSRQVCLHPATST
jgi:hypothetical protein